MKTVLYIAFWLLLIDQPDSLRVNSAIGLVAIVVLADLWQFIKESFNLAP